MQKNNFFIKITNLLQFSQDEQSKFLQFYNQTLNEQFIILSNLSKEEIDELSHKDNPKDIYKYVFSKVKDKENLLKKFREFVDEFHQKILSTFIETAKDDQKEQISAYFREITQNSSLNKSDSPKV